MTSEPIKYDKIDEMLKPYGFWDGFLELMTVVGMVATVCFIAGYVIVKQPSGVTQCEPTKKVLARSIFK
jgi:hypothetical protein